MLAEIVAKGGNLLLNIGPGPDGTWDPGAYELLAEIGKWMDANGEAIYSTRPVKPYKQGKVAYTQGKTGIIYAIYLPDENENMPGEKLLLNEFFPKPGTTFTLLGDKTPLKYKSSEDGCVSMVAGCSGEAM